ncbi:MAG: type II toxin-antitoxin system VapC family toxin [Acidobacteriota bacterium]|jgi:predicted nucleic acid-binding protein|nr:type II toxin-antitoxin system VapC family toxin [Acidobacteriota bacterium]
MNGTRSILDSNAVIFASKQKIDIAKLRSKYDEFYVSIISYMEVYGFDFQNEAEKNLIDELFANLEIVGINKEIADQAVIYRKNKIKKIKLPDAVILATAKYVNADLLTGDWKDFQNIDSSVSVMSLDDLN